LQKAKENEKNNRAWNKSFLNHTSAIMDANDNWTVAQAEDDGKPILLRIRNPAPKFAKRLKFGQMITVAWPYESSGDHGMPDDDELASMTQLEELLVAAFEDEKQGFLSVVVTGNSNREWQFYAIDIESAGLVINESLADYDPFPIQISTEEDPDWDAYERFLEIAREG